MFLGQYPSEFWGNLSAQVSADISLRQGWGWTYWYVPNLAGILIREPPVLIWSTTTLPERKKEIIILHSKEFGRKFSLGGFHSHGGTPKQMVYNGTTHRSKWMIGGYPYDLGNHHLVDWPFDTLMSRAGTCWNFPRKSWMFCHLSLSNLSPNPSWEWRRGRHIFSETPETIGKNGVTPFRK